jgi:hypothetical protein
MSTISGSNSFGSLRIHTRASQPRTSSNHTFQEQFRHGLKSGVDLTNSALRQVAKPIPGSAALSATLSDAARNLSEGNKLDGGLSNGAINGDGDMSSLQEDMARNNQELLTQQIRVAYETTTSTTKSNMVKAIFDALKSIGSNIRP